MARDASRHPQGPVRSTPRSDRGTLAAGRLGGGLCLGSSLGVTPPAQGGGLLVEVAGFAAQGPAGGREINAEVIQSRTDDASQSLPADRGGAAPPDLIAMQGGDGMVSLDKRGSPGVKGVSDSPAPFGPYRLRARLAVEIRAG